MADRKSLVDPNDTPEDVATLYSWANLHGAKYRDFSASRAQTREKARQRVQEAMDAERRRSSEEADAQKTAEILRASETARSAEVARQAEMLARENAVRAERQAAEMAAQQALYAAQHSAPAAAPQYTWQPPAPSYDVSPAQHPPVAPAYVPPPSYAPQGAPLYTPPAPAAPSYAAPAVQAPAPSAPAFAAPAPSYFAPQAAASANYSTNGNGTQQSYTPAPPPPAYTPQPVPQAAYTPAREEHYLQNRAPWTPVETKDNHARPAWLSSERPELAPPPAVQQAPDDTLQGSRDRLTSRWFALKGVFSGNAAQPEAAPAPSTSRAPVLAVFSLAGGVGKTSLVATLGRALSARGERVLLVDTAAFGLLPFFFGARDQRPGVLRTFTPPGVSGDAPIQMLTVDPDTLGPENAPQETLTQEIARNGRAASRVMVDLATASGAITRRILRLSPTVLVPVIPDMSSVVSVGSIDAFFQRNLSASGQPIMPFYILNQFDPSLPLHLDVREVLREQLGDRLLPFALRRTPAVSEALAEGMTVVDYAPNSSVAEDFGNLAIWVKSLAAPATNGFRGVRWSER
jgi:cellulose synthase operon protein YhjQ